ncbi:MAG: hypothetical protein HKP58_19960 [Desulfatitalea sp.]|nr:hypothetical protein [Desulfatitalea sp.]NNK02694.1 hypothetical protein [Desulfatitalea sp.]
MDDFLHNLRSGKLKSERPNRPYGDPQYKGGPRRNVNDRRKGHHDNKESTERLNALKEVVETFVESQNRMADAYHKRIRVEERKARALEIIAESIYKTINPEADNIEALFDVEARATLKAQIPPPSPASETDKTFTPEAVIAETQSEDWMADEASNATSSRKLTELDRQTLQTVIGQMRDKGNSWENIARHITAQGYPTISGKGTWRGVMAKNLYEKMAEK